MAESEQDQSANTARFRAFAQQGEDDLPAPWRMRASGSRVLLFAVGVVCVAVVIGVIAFALS
jgi:hypothetical protein